MISKIQLVLLVVTLFPLLSDGEAPKKEIVDRKILVRKSVDGSSKLTPLKQSLNSLIQGMELVDAKRSLPRWLVESSKTSKEQTTKQLKKLLSEDLNRAYQNLPMWLKNELPSHSKSVKPKLNQWIDQIASLNTTAKYLGKSQLTARPTPVVDPPFKTPYLAIDSNENIDEEILGQIVHFSKDERRTVNRFLSALREIADDEIKEATEKREAQNSIYPVENSCQDVGDDCQTYKGFCKSFSKQMKEHCALTCRFCEKPNSKLICGKDIAKREGCQMIKKLGLCKQPTAQTLCPATCQCETCTNSLHGCCWDKKTLKKDEVGSNCPACRDKFALVCRIFKSDCHSKDAGTKSWMMKNCMQTCGYCSTVTEQEKTEKSNECKDAHNQKDFCPLWKNAGWCKDKKKIMSKYCSKTCYNCNLNSDGDAHPNL